jgi:hypothetical protein
MQTKYNKPLTIEELRNLRDEDIDTSDIPELDEEWFKNATLVLPHTKK